jgi:hypothetical protein
MSSSGSLFLVLISTGLSAWAISGFVQNSGGFESWMLLFLAPIVTALVGAQRTFKLERLWAAGQREGIVRLQDSASSWCGGALVLSVFSALAVIDNQRGVGLG